QCGHTVVGFIDDDLRHVGQLLNDIPILELANAAARYRGAFVVGGIGSPIARQQVVGKATASGLVPGVLVHPRVEASNWLSVGDGTVICAGCILTTNITIGCDVQINLDCTIGHDVVLEDHVTLAPGVHVSGCVRVEKSAYIGTGANIINGSAESPLVIGAGAVIGAGPCVPPPIPPRLTAVGVPAKPAHTPA